MTCPIRHVSRRRLKPLVRRRCGLVSWLLLAFFVNPVLYEMVARDGDVLQV
jgi:hypothetical protein